MGYGKNKGIKLYLINVEITNSVNDNSIIHYAISKTEKSCNDIIEIYNKQVEEWYKDYWNLNSGINSERYIDSSCEIITTETIVPKEITFKDMIQIIDYLKGL